MSIIVNPGTGPVTRATEQHANKNMRQLVKDSGADSFERTPKVDYGEGRYAFNLKRGSRTHEIQMPGLALKRVRYLDHPDQNIWDFPRLYVDGSSWVWKYAVSAICSAEDAP